MTQLLRRKQKQDKGESGRRALFYVDNEEGLDKMIHSK